MKLRAEFDHFKHVTDRSKIAALLEEGEERFRRQAHPDPYISMFLCCVDELCAQVNRTLHPHLGKTIRLQMNSRNSHL